MQRFMVGGAVRDELLGLPVKDRDWVVVGAGVQQLCDLGFKQVGNDFPVFLHPETGEEHALARTERKTGAGYHGFTVHTDPEVTLEEDLARRDLTINAIARDERGDLIDPHGGRRDLEQGWLRHVSPAFAEDPVRILRLARFVARYRQRGFRIAPETLALMRAMVDAGEVDALVSERVWMETERALAEPDPDAFVEVLHECGALARIFPELARLFGVPQPPEHHPEIDTGLHILLCLQQAAQRTTDPATRFAVLVHDLGKGTTPEAEWPRHLEHEKRGVPLVKALCARYKVPVGFRELALLVTEHHLRCHQALNLRPGKLLKLLLTVDALRRPERFERFLLACECDARGRTGLEQREYPQRPYLQDAAQALRDVPIQPLLDQGLRGAAMGEALQREQLARLTRFRDDYH